MLVNQSVKEIKGLQNKRAGRKWGLVWGFASKLMPHIWSIVHMKFNKSPPPAPYAPGGEGGAYN